LIIIWREMSGRGGTGPDQPKHLSGVRPPRQERDFSLASFGLGVAGVVAFILFILVRYRWVECDALKCGPKPGSLLFDWLPGVIAFAAVAGALVGFFGREGSRVRRVGFGLAVLNVLLALLAFAIWVEWGIESIPD
jgi:hypothetical protein